MYILALLAVSLFIVWLIWLYTDPRPFNERFTKKFLTVAAIILFVVTPQLISFSYFPFPPTKWDVLIIAVGLLLFITGLLTCIWAKLTMRRYWGPPGEHDIRRQDKLLVHGPFAFTRNPIYLGMFFLVLGFGLSLRSIFFFLSFVLLWYFTSMIKKEERLLKHHFGEKFDRYRDRVPRFIGIGKFSL